MNATILSLSLLLLLVSTFTFVRTHTNTEFVDETPKTDVTASVLATFHQDNHNMTLAPLLPFRASPYRQQDNVTASATPNNDTTLEALGRRFLKSPEERGKICMKNVSLCLKEDEEYKITTDKLSKYLFNQMPPFDLTTIPEVSEQCKKHIGMYTKDLQQFKLWALKMYDSTAKLPSGILNGNINQYGDFDQCMSINSDENDISGQYCLAYMQFDTPQSSYLAALHNLIQSHSPFKSKLEDPGHRVPRFSSINWAFCVPHSCGPKDIELGLNYSLKSILSDTEIKVRVQVDPIMCQTYGKEQIPTSTIIVSLFFLGIICTALAATAYDYYVPIDQNPLFTSFSLRRNVRSLLSLQRPGDDIAAVHGIRFINAFMLIIAHKSMALFFVPYANRTEMSENLGQPWTVIGRAASLYTDPFIMLSGALTAYSFFGRLQKKENISVWNEYISRLFRLVPTLGALILFATFILPWLGSGPQWNLVVTHHAEICKEYWWRNLLFIHNYFGFKKMCLTHTHHVGIDTQLFFVSPLMILAVWKWPKKGILGLLMLATVSTIMRYYVTYYQKLSNYIHFGTSITQLFNTADNMYILPTHRATVYIMGIILGYILRSFRKIELKPMYIRLGNALAAVSFSVAFFGPAFMGSIEYIYNPTHAAWYAAFAPITWCLSFGWIIFVSHLGYQDGLTRFLSWKGFLITTRLSYAIYLTQFPVFFYNVGMTRIPEHFGFFRLMINFKEYGYIVVLSAVLTVLFDTPFQNIKNIIFRKKRRLQINEEIAQRKVK